MKITGFIFAVLVIVQSTGAGAVVISDNLSSGGSGFFTVSDNFWEAQRFNSDSTDLVLNSVTLGLSSSSTGQYRISLFSDVADHPGVTLGTLFSGTAASKPPIGDVQFAGLSQSLSPTTNYWVVLSVDAGESTAIGWEASSSLLGTGTGFQPLSNTSSNQGASWSIRGAAHRLQVVAVPATVPLPAAVWLLGSTLGGLGFARFKKTHHT